MHYFIDEEYLHRRVLVYTLNLNINTFKKCNSIKIFLKMHGFWSPCQPNHNHKPRGTSSTNPCVVCAFSGITLLHLIFYLAHIQFVMQENHSKVCQTYTFLTNTHKNLTLQKWIVLLGYLDLAVEKPLTWYILRGVVMILNTTVQCSHFKTSTTNF